MSKQQLYVLEFVPDSWVTNLMVGIREAKQTLLKMCNSLIKVSVEGRFSFTAQELGLEDASYTH